VKLVVGLGNPGKQYENTRHNIGFAVIAELAKQAAAGIPRAKFDGEWIEANWGGQKCLLGKPLTFMNRSGMCVQPARDFFKVEDSDILVLCDDLALPAGKLRMRAKGSAGGQKGLDDILKRLGTDAICRLRIGIGAAPPGWDAAALICLKLNDSASHSKHPTALCCLVLIWLLLMRAGRGQGRRDAVGVCSGCRGSHRFQPDFLRFPSDFSFTPKFFLCAFAVDMSFGCGMMDDGGGGGGCFVGWVFF